jgi:glycerate 2-kinase
VSAVRILAAPDKFKGTATAGEVAAAIAAAARRAGHEAVELPLADGGDGTLAALGGGNRRSRVTGPLGAPVPAEWRLDGGLAVIEAAQAFGLVFAGGARGNDAVAATSRGVGELLGEAVRAGARRIVLGLGGTACTDGGWGAVAALGANVRFGAPGGPELLLACDVTTRFADAARVFGPQKGAGPAEVDALTRRLRRVERTYLTEYGVDVSRVRGAGAAGGLAGGLAALGGRLVPGFDLIAGELGLDRALGEADWVITGEGHVDAESFAGKVVGGVAARAAAAGRPVLAVAGGHDAGIEGRIPVVSLVARFGERAAWTEPLRCVEAAVLGVLAPISRPQGAML